MPSTVSRSTFTLPSDQVAVLTNVARRLRVSQSALVSILLEDTLPHVAVGGRDDEDADGAPRRLIGGNISRIRDQVRQALRDGHARARGARTRAAAKHK